MYNDRSRTSAFFAGWLSWFAVRSAVRSIRPSTRSPNNNEIQKRIVASRYDAGRSSESPVFG